MTALLDLHCPPDFDPEQPLTLREQCDGVVPPSVNSTAPTNSSSVRDASVDSDEKRMDVDLDDDTSEQPSEEHRWYHFDHVHGMNAYELVHGTGSRAVIAGIGELTGFGLLKVQTYSEPASTLEILGTFHGGSVSGEAAVRARIHGESNPGNNDEISTYLFKGKLNRCSISNGTLWFTRNECDNNNQKRHDNDDQDSSSSTMMSMMTMLNNSNEQPSPPTAQFRMDFEQTWVKRVKKKGYPHHYPADRFIDCYATLCSRFGCIESGHYKVDRDLQMWGKIAWATVSSQLNEWRLVRGVLNSMDTLRSDQCNKITLCNAICERVSLMNEPWIRQFWMETQSMNSLFQVRSSCTFTGNILLFDELLTEQSKKSWEQRLISMGSSQATKFVSKVKNYCLLVGNFLFDKSDPSMVLPFPIGLIRVFDQNGQCVWDESVLDCDITRLQIGTDSLEPKRESSVTPKSTGSRSTVKRKTPQRTRKSTTTKKKTSKRKKVATKTAAKKGRSLTVKSKSTKKKRPSIYDESDYSESECDDDETTSEEDDSSMDRMLESDESSESSNDDWSRSVRKRNRKVSRRKSTVKSHRRKNMYTRSRKRTSSIGKSRKSGTKKGLTQKGRNESKKGNYLKN